MRRFKVLIISGVCGGIVGALLTRFKFESLNRIPFFTPDHQLLSHRGFLLAGAALWAIFGLYWDIASKNSAAARTSETKPSRGVHVFLANIALLLEIAPIHGLGRFLPVSLVTMTVGLAVELAGLLLAIWSRRHLAQYWSGEITIKVDHEIVRTGPYGMLRHPIYTGLLAMYLGVALVTGEWLAAIGLGMAVYAYWRKIGLEEALLDAHFGEAYETYCQETWRLVPGVY